MSKVRYSKFLSLVLLSLTKISHQFSSNNSNNSKHLSQSQRFRREEEARRKERISENIPGKTSALPGEKDFEINPQRTEIEWQSQASISEREVMALTSKGLEFLKMLKLQDADDAFNKVYQTKPSAYCWQAGVVKFYLNDYTGAADLFARNGILYESRFGGVAGEERIWRDACELKLLSLKKKENTDSGNGKRRIQDIAAMNDLDDIVGPSETRKVVRIAMDLFKATLDNDLPTVALQRAKLRSICGEYDGDGSTVTKKADYKMWRLSSWFYLGLHYDVVGDMESSKKCMKMALRQSVAGNGDDIIQVLPMLHMAQRDFFDDEEFEEDSDSLIGLETDEENSSIHKIKSSKHNVIDKIARESIQSSIQQMKLMQLQDALKSRGLKSSGSKSVLQERLLTVLLDDAGLTDEDERFR